MCTTLCVLGLLSAASPAFADDTGTDGYSTGGGVDVRGWQSGAVQSTAPDPSPAESAPEHPSDRQWRIFYEKELAEPTCASYGTCPPVVAAAPERALSIIGVDDIASFVPDAPGAATEPDGWGLVGAPINFILTANEHVVSGVLLGRSADVRFSPIASHWSFDDGTQRDADTLGETWSALGAGAFTETATSHVFTSAGWHVVGTAVEYSAEYRTNGGSWLAVRGTVRVSGPELRIRLFEGRSALVDRACTEGVVGPGC